MKRYLFLYITIGMFLSAVITSCDKDADKVDPGIMQMTTNVPGDVTISLAGTGLVTIDWGDGSIKETKTLPVNDYFEFNHNYLVSNTRTIRIYGDNITGLNCSEIQLTDLDVSRNTVLTGLYCFDNQLRNLDVSKNTALIYLGCGGNQLTSLDVSHNVALGSLQCGNNELTSLDVSKNTELYYLSCWHNQLINLDMNKNAKLSILSCNANQLSATMLDVLFETLHNNSLLLALKLIYIYDNPGAIDCNLSIATDKGWTVDTTTE